MKQDKVLESLAQKAQALHQAGKLAEARRAYQDILVISAQEPLALMGLGGIHAQQEDFEKSIDCFKQALAHAPDNPLIYNNLGNAYKQLGQPEQAVESYRQALVCSPDFEIAHNNLGALYYQLNDLDKALTHLHQAVQARPDYIEAHNNLGLLFLKQNNLEAARVQFQNVVSLAPTMLRAHYHLGNIFLLEEAYEKAKASFEKVLALDPNQADVLSNLGVVCMRESAPQQAIDYFGKALALDEHHLDARNNLAALFLEHGKYENALKHYQELLANVSDDQEALYNAGVCAMSLGQYQEAISLFEKVEESYQDHSSAQINIGTIYMRMGNKQKAIAKFEAILQKDPDHEVVRYMYQALTGQGSFEQAPSAYVQQLFDNYAQVFDEHLVKSLSYQLPNIVHQLLLAQKLLSSSLTVCDLGCGTGLLAEAIHEQVGSITGVDLSPQMLDVARGKHCYQVLHQADIMSYLSKEKGQFGLMLALDVLGYMGELSALFDQVYQRLLPGGHWIFSVEEKDGAGFQLGQTGRFSHGTAYLTELIDQHHFENIYQQTHQGRTQEDTPVMLKVFILRRPQASADPAH